MYILITPNTHTHTHTHTHIYIVLHKHLTFTLIFPVVIFSVELTGSVNTAIMVLLYLFMALLV